MGRTLAWVRNPARRAGAGCGGALDASASQPLGVPAHRGSRAARRQCHGLGANADRPVHSGAARRTRSRSRSGSGQADAVAPREVRPSRAAAHGNRDRGIPSGSDSARVRASRRSIAKLSALRREVGPTLARCSALRRLDRTGRRHQSAVHMALSRLCHRRVEQGHALRRIHLRATRRGHAPARGRGGSQSAGSYRNRISGRRHQAPRPARQNQDEIRRGGRADRHDGEGLHGPDDGLRPLP